MVREDCISPSFRHTPESGGVCVVRGNLRSIHFHPHPNPLPEGEGACTLVFILGCTLLPTPVSPQGRGGLYVGIHTWLYTFTYACQPSRERGLVRWYSYLAVHFYLRLSALKGEGACTLVFILGCTLLPTPVSPQGRGGCTLVFILVCTLLPTSVSPSRERGS